MAEELRLWAINVDRFRQCFAASPDLADTLRKVTDSLTASDQHPRSHSLLSKLGPLMRRVDDAPVIRPGVPTVHDAESMMTSRFMPTERLSACWVLARAWLDDLAVATTTIPLPRTQIDDLDFDLVRVGIPTDLSIRHLWRRSLDIPLRPADDMSIGYTPFTTVNALTDQWRSALDSLEEDTVRFAAPLLEFTSEFPHHAEQQPVPPDLIAWWTSR